MLNLPLCFRLHHKSANALEQKTIVFYRQFSANRIYVQSGVYVEFAEKLSAAVKKLKVGNGFEDGINMGPLISEAALEKVESHLSDAKLHGAEIKAGGKSHSLGGTYFEPTVITGVKSNMQFATKETFGPLAPLFEFETEDEAIVVANYAEFGLAGYFYTKDMARTFRVSEQLEVGMVGVNTGIH